MRLHMVLYDCGDCYSYYCDGQHCVGVYSTLELAADRVDEHRAAFLAMVCRTSVGRDRVIEAARALGHARDAEQETNPAVAEVLNDCTVALFALAIRVED